MRNPRSWLCREQCLSEARGFLRTSRSATSCLLSSLHLPGGGSASRWGQFQLLPGIPEPSPPPPPGLPLCKPLALRDVPASVRRALRLMPACCAPQLNVGPLCQGFPARWAFPRRSDSVSLTVNRQDAHVSSSGAGGGRAAGSLGQSCAETRAAAACRGVGSAVTQPPCSWHFSPPGALDERRSTQEPLGPLVFKQGRSRESPCENYVKNEAKAASECLMHSKSSGCNCVSRELGWR